MEKKGVAIVVGGGPAPGINGVISAATIEGVNRGHQVYGIVQGFERIGQGDEDAIVRLSINDVSRIHSEGGSILGTSRFNPSKNPDSLSRVVEVLSSNNIGYLVTIGGDDTASSAAAVSKAAGGKIAVGHVPKTIDNDLPLPGMDSTFGFQSAREAGTDIAETLMVDAKTTGRWYIVIAMGRKAGHLALGIGISSGATLTVIPEEFGDKLIHMSTLVDVIAGSMIRRMSRGRNYGVVVLAEGLVEKLQPESIPDLVEAERDAHGHIRLAEVEFGPIIKNAVRGRLKDLGFPKITVVDKNVGYELRCRSPIPFDREYTRQLGYGVIEFLLSGGSEAMVTRQGDRLVPIPFSEMVDPVTGRARVRFVDIDSAMYKIARKYMIRLGTKQLEDPNRLAEMAKCTKLSPAEFRQVFEPSASEFGWG